MNKSEIHSSIKKAVSENQSLESISIMLKRYKEEDVDQATIVDVVEEMRTAVSEEHEDRLLEILDIVTGHCNFKYKVW